MVPTLATSSSFRKLDSRKLEKQQEGLRTNGNGNGNANGVVKFKNIYQDIEESEIEDSLED